jgi:cytochrome bd ubiquinol oxidase subunit II
MHLADVPAILMLVGLAAYSVLGGADFGAGFWSLFTGGGTRGQEIREHAHHAMAPVWEANHVWLIFVLVVCWTAYPRAFGSIMSTLAVPFFAAAVGIIMRGAAYALRSGGETPREERIIDTVFSVSSVVTPFALGTVVGAIASGRVPVGNARGDLVTSWLNPTSGLIGGLAVVTAAYLGAVHLAADAARMGRSGLVEGFRRRALAIGVVAGAVALGGIGVVRIDAEFIADDLTSGDGLPAMLASVAAGVATLFLVWRRRFEPARVTSAIAVAAIVAGWALAQGPTLLPGLSIEEAAAPRATLIALLVSIGAGALVLAPSLGLLFALVLHGRFDPYAHARAAVVPRAEPERPRRAMQPRTLSGFALTCLVVGSAATFFFEEGWVRALGILGLFVFVLTGFVLIASPGELGDGDRDPK